MPQNHLAPSISQVTKPETRATKTGIPVARVSVMP